MSRFQICANHRNGHKSNGPKTPNGKAVSKMNALKHGLRSADVVVRGRCIKESPREFNEFYQAFREDLRPVGMVEEMLVHQIAATSWRMQRVLKAESGEIALSVDNSQWKRKNRDVMLVARLWELADDPTSKMRESAFGNSLMYNQLERVRQSVEKEGQLTDDALKQVMFLGKPYRLTRQLEELRVKLQQNSEGLDEAGLQAKQKEETLAYLRREMSHIGWEHDRCEKREAMEEDAQQAADVLPSAQTLEKLLRYETALQKKLYRAMNHLERIQRRRKGESIPAPVAMEISTGT